ncbi:hypothetical protein ACFQZE_06815 [Paenibacillus sp. GCM10027627]|uniref:hypothetical protein n=1 Tax=unclassified Paenibacillus TaxID=185978 RepID=UPI003635CB8C
MTELQPTYGSFSLKGIVVGLQNDRYYSEGEKEGGDKWHRLNFNVKVQNAALIPVELMGSTATKIKLKRNYKKNDSIIVNWKERYTTSNYRIHMPLKVSLTTSESFELTSFDAIENIKENLKDGDSVYINGSIQFQEYNGKVQAKFSIRDIGRLDQQLEANELHEQDAYFSQEIVFLNIEKDRNKSQYLVDSLILVKVDDVIRKIPYCFVINYNKYIGQGSNEYITETIKMFKDMTYGTTVRIFGNINYLVPTIEVEGKLVVTGSAIKELEITGGSLKSIVRNRYSVENINETVDSNPFIYEEKNDSASSVEHEWAF